MEEITFNFPMEINKIQKYNAIMQFLVNRANEFNEKKYDYFIINDVQDTALDYIQYHILSILATIRQKPLYINKKIKKMPWHDNDKYMVEISGFWKLFWYKIKKRGLRFSINTIDCVRDKAKYPQIFLGMKCHTIQGIAENLYEYRGVYGS